MVTKRELLFGCEVGIDMEKTQQWYARAEAWGCECADCVNFVELAKKKSLPDTVLETLTAFEIPPEKATYVCHLAQVDGGHLYQFSYRITGQILKENRSDVIPDARCCHELYPYGAPDFPEPHFDLEFYEVLPWILESPRE